MEKYNTVKRKNQKLEEALTAKEQEKVSILLEQQNEKQKALLQGELEWLTNKIKMFTEEEQKTILAWCLCICRTRLDSNTFNSDTTKRHM
jgi:hypothetical protein